MKFFIDSANLDEIRSAAEMGIVCGVTTNPSLVAKEGRDYVQTFKRNLRNCRRPDLRRSQPVFHNGRRNGERRPRDYRDAPQHGGKNPHDCGRFEGNPRIE